jgi:hypothetical protein
MERPHAQSIKRRSRSRDCFRESGGGEPGPDHLGGLDDHPALLRNRISAVAGMAALLNSVTSKEPLNCAHTYKAAVVATARPDATPTTATTSRRAGRDRCFDDGSSRRHDVRRPTRHAVTAVPRGVGQPLLRALGFRCALAPAREASEAAAP